MKISMYYDDEHGLYIEYLNQGWFYYLHHIDRLAEGLILDLTKEVYC